MTDENDDKIRTLAINSDKMGKICAGAVKNFHTLDLKGMLRIGVGKCKDIGWG